VFSPLLYSGKLVGFRSQCLSSVLSACLKLSTRAREESSRTKQVKQLLVGRSSNNDKQRRKYKNYSLPKKGRMKQIDRPAGLRLEAPGVTKSSSASLGKKPRHRSPHVATQIRSAVGISSARGRTTRRKGRRKGLGKEYIPR
jgi:hypothetical protein